MKTITFYSYKGGVGRSLALSNMAMRLSQLNKKVCVLDFDLDAPGLRFKFAKDYIYSKPIERGIVDYIYHFSKNGNIPLFIQDYSIVLEPNNRSDEPIIFISAGDIESSDYWRKLSMINWHDLFYSRDAKGIRFFLDLKAKIEEEFKPDYLLIDSRTGITDISGITLKIMADEAVILAVNNRENIFGSKRIIKSLLDESHRTLNLNMKLTFVLTRLPYINEISDKENEYIVIEELKREMSKSLNVASFEISVIHTDKKLEEKESYILGNNEKGKLSWQTNNTSAIVTRDYLNLFDKLTNNEFTESETYVQLKQADLLFSKASNETDSAKKLIHLNEAILLNSQNHAYYLERGKVYWTLNRIDEALKEFNKALSLKPTDVATKYGLGLLLAKKQMYEEAIKYYEEVIDFIPETAQYKAFALFKLNKMSEALSFLGDYIAQNPNVASALNARSDLYRRKGEYRLALEDITIAIELDPDEPLYFATLAEIRAGLNEIDSFYLSLTVALSNGLTAQEMAAAKDVYQQFSGSKKFDELMNKYQIDTDVIFNNKIS